MFQTQSQLSEMLQVMKGMAMHQQSFLSDMKSDMNNKFSQLEQGMLGTIGEVWRLREVQGSSSGMGIRPVRIAEHEELIKQNDQDSFIDAEGLQAREDSKNDMF